MEGDGNTGEGLRERKKRETRQHISDVATNMFLDRGFENVRVADVAEACGVSEKTVYNYFKTKESLMLDEVEPMIERVRVQFGPGATDSPPKAAAKMLSGMFEVAIERVQESRAGRVRVEEFMAMIDDTPSLSAARDQATKQTIEAAAQAMTERYGRPPGDAEVYVIAVTLLSLIMASWRGSIKHLRDAKSLKQARQAAEREHEQLMKVFEAAFEASTLSDP